MSDAINWGEAYLDHYERCFGDFTKREVFQPHQEGPVIQVLSYDNVMRGCRVYASIGLTHYSGEVGSIGEALVCTSPSDDWPVILASSLFYLVQSRMDLGWGMVVGGVDAVAPFFCGKYDKSALYFSLPTLFPEHVRVVRRGHLTGMLYLVTPITTAERAYFTKYGAAEFEQLLARSGVDILEIDRPSSI
ncbi:MAG: suppressor of fused domain protein [Fimbriiglobus sp.]